MPGDLVPHQNDNWTLSISQISYLENQYLAQPSACSANGMPFTCSVLGKADNVKEREQTTCFNDRLFNFMQYALTELSGANLSTYLIYDREPLANLTLSFSISRDMEGNCLMSSNCTANMKHNHQIVTYPRSVSIFSD